MKNLNKCKANPYWELYAFGERCKNVRNRKESGSNPINTAILDKFQYDIPCIYTFY
jgi:hypothetical protein